MLAISYAGGSGVVSGVGVGSEFCSFFEGLLGVLAESTLLWFLSPRHPY